VCTLDPDDPHSPGLLAQYARDFGIKGMRSIPARDGRLDHPGVRALWKTALDRGLVINVLIGPDKAPECERLLADFPKLNVVLDHCLNLKAGQSPEPVVRMARHRNLHAKLPCLPTGSATGFPCADMHAPCLKIVEAFGAERCVWGSVFPCELWTPRVTYAQHLRIFTHELALPESQRRAILEETATRLWFR
ncbi:MAG: amidohydrolase family protein, partial [Bryobacteraceae bacterium]